MKTFKWTVPEPLPSAVEKDEWRKKNKTGSFEPTNRELKEFERWEKIRTRGLKAFIYKLLLLVTCAALVFWLLYHFEVITSLSTALIAFLGGPIGAYISWTRHIEKRHAIQEFLNTRSEQGGVSNGSPFTLD